MRDLTQELLRVLDAWAYEQAELGIPRTLVCVTVAMHCADSFDAAMRQHLGIELQEDIEDDAPAN